MNKKPPELPNIEDATLRACLAPLMEAIGAEPPDQPVAREAARFIPPGSNDNPPPRGEVGPPESLAAWRARADDDFGTFRTIELFLAMTDREREAAAAEFPRQIGGTVARLTRIKQRLAAQYDTITVGLSLLERALARSAAPGTVGPEPDPKH